MEQSDIRELNQHILKESEFLKRLDAEIRKVVIGQDALVERVLIGLLADGHILLEGVPGLAKTLLVKTVAQSIHSDFSRLPFTPDLLPPAKVQSALLEAMQERQVTIGDHTYPLEVMFLVLATQNPIDQEGTYPLPEAQVDRFMLKVVVDYPPRTEEKMIIDRMTGAEPPQVEPVIEPRDILNARKTVRSIYVDDKLKEYILDLIMATRFPDRNGLAQLRPLIAYGASPRAGIYMVMAARANAFIQGRGYVAPEDVKKIAAEVLQHRVIPTYEAEAESISSSDIVQDILNHVEVP